jgi:hypothetical protein
MAKRREGSLSRSWDLPYYESSLARKADIKMGKTMHAAYTKPTTRTCASGFASMYLCVVRRFECPASS